MHKFKDNAGHEWEIDVNCWSLEQVRRRAGVNLAQLTVDQKVAEGLADPVTLCGVLWILVREQAEKRGVSDVDFGRALAGDALGESTQALLAGIIDFFDRETRPTVLKMVALGQEIGRQIQERTLKALDDPKLIEAVLASGAPSGNSPASSASTLVPAAAG